MKTWLDRIFRRKKTDTDGAVQSSPGPYEGFSADDVVQRMLAHLNATWQSQPLSDNRGTDFSFTYQRGAFHTITHHDHHDVIIHFLFFEETTTGQLDNVRYACNAFNQHTIPLKAIYSIQGEEHKVFVHLTANLRLTLWTQALEDDFAQLLSLCFEGARNFRSMLQDIISQDVTNLEERNAFGQRERQLAHEAEIMQQEGLGRTYDTEHLLLSDLLAVVTGKSDLGEMSPASDVDLTDVMLSLGNEGAPGEGKSIVTSIEGGKRKFLVHLDELDTIETSLYYRVTVVNLSGDGKHSSSHVHDQDDHLRSFVISYCPASERDKLSEFDYLWQEAKAKRERGHELSADERFMLQSADNDVAYCLYWGRRFYLSRDFYHALIHLENAYRALYTCFHQLDKAERREFFELCYYIGQCYMYLDMPRHAYYYLDGLFNLNSIRYTQAYINAIVKGRDFRALGVVSAVLANVERLYEEGPETDSRNREDLYEFILFLRRSKARILIDQESLDEAESLLRSLLASDSRHETLLLEQLAHVANLRALKASANANKGTLSVSTEFPKPQT